MSDFHQLVVKDITRETSKAVSIAFEIPDSLQKEFRFIAGQYITIKTKIEGKEIRRAYSICSAPESGSLRVAVKEVENGIFSRFANTSLKEGDTLEVHPPEGKFLLKTHPEARKNYMAFAAGSGITPIVSMIKSVLQQEPESKFILLYGNQQLTETIFAKELLSLMQKYPDRLFIEFFYSRKEEENSNFGRIEKSTINYLIKNKFKDVSFDSYYICGPEAMIQTITDVLVEKGISKEVIHFELFTSSTEQVEVQASLDGKTKIHIVVDDEAFEFVMDQKKTVLDAALDEDIDAPYSCQGGICSSCVCRVTEGSAVMDKNSILTDGEIADGLVLACQAHPTSAVLKIDFDDV